MTDACQIKHVHPRVIKSTRPPRARSVLSCKASPLALCYMHQFPKSINLMDPSARFSDPPPPRCQRFPPLAPTLSRSKCVRCATNASRSGCAAYLISIHSARLDSTRRVNVRGIHAQRDANTPTCRLILDQVRSENEDNGCYIVYLTIERRRDALRVSTSANMYLMSKFENEAFW